ncbi:helix-turn-helix domain-containing protein [Actibacterium sp. MT2.3-13A]|uniref:GlxA family transcriptional regulator n=1 Tax=Actibacterium sp. MT2.3-13A TaxID=2828332 RepID=UPI001BA4CC6E|nr:helix-turn-helix domain-containing protein [Actibacterium sp. MT2.3-13A]
MPADLALVHYPGASQAALAGMTEMFSHCARMQRREGMEALTLATVTADTLPAARLDAVILPPAFGNDDFLSPDPALVRWLRGQHAGGALMASACAGAFYLGAAGVLDGRRVTTHWGLEARLQQRFPRAKVNTDPILTRDGRIVTAGGLLSWIDLALELTAQMSSPRLMRELGRHFVTDTGRREQRHYRGFRPPADHGDTAILRVQRRIETGFAQALTIRGLAAEAGLSERSLLRRFRAATGLTPLAYLQHTRIQAAQQRLEGGPDPVETIAHEVGYEDATAFRKVFRRLTGLTPSDYRRRLRR